MKTVKAAKKHFTSRLTTWHATTNNRSLPWKNEKDPYRIWLSEVILQQTRALQGLPYYLRFIDAFPTVEDMAAADDDEAFRLWQGLGYYNRCKNMLATARIITHELGGRFPQTYDGLLALKGIGPYTAAAITSFAYGFPHAVVDGNVYRVLARYFGIETPFDTTDGKKIFSSLAHELLDTADAAAYNQAIMDLGATVCTPRNPLCEQCPLHTECIACNQDLTGVLPVKSRKQSVKNRYFNYLVLTWEDLMWIHKRTQGDIWENLYEPYLVETSELLDLDDLYNDESVINLQLKHGEIEYVSSSTQRLTHQVINARFYTVKFSRKPVIKNRTGTWLNTNELKKTAFPKTLVSFLKNNFYF